MSARSLTMQADPDYANGNLKVMAVALSGEAAGSATADVSSLIRGPFVLTAGVPTFVAPGDTFEVGVTIANNVAGSGTGAQVIDGGGPIGAFGNCAKRRRFGSVTVAEGREETVTFVVHGRRINSARRILCSGHPQLGQESNLRETLSVEAAGGADDRGCAREFYQLGRRMEIRVSA